MPNATWPGSLPTIWERTGYTEKFPGMSIETQMDVGVPKKRKRFTANVRPFHRRLLMTRAQSETFRTFYTTTLGGGSLPFDDTDPINGNAATFRIVGEPERTPRAYDAFYMDMDLILLP